MLNTIGHLFYEEDSFWIFVLVTVVLGGGAAFLTGRAIATTWRPWWQVAVYMLVLGGAVRFFHMALFNGTLLSLHYYLVDTIFCLLFGFWGYRATRAGQMAEQYSWIYRRAGHLSWTRKNTAPNAAGSESG
jgi:small-conductance mechanosensitive channel